MKIFDKGEGLMPKTKKNHDTNDPIFQNTEQKTSLYTENFADRHIGVQAHDIKEMLNTLNVQSLDALIDATVPRNIRTHKPLRLPTALTEQDALKRIKVIMSENSIFKTYIGMGYSDCITPTPIQRHFFENPGWYTQYTPYQSEISQGRLEALLNFQTMIADLTALPLSNASLLDEGTAAAEAMSLAFHKSKGRSTFLIAQDCHPQTIEILKTRSEPLNIKLIIDNIHQFPIDDSIFGVLVQYPTTYGDINNYSKLFESIHHIGGLCIMAADLLALTLLKPPGEWGADIAVGNTQRFGVPLGFGGPHAGYFATKAEFKRMIPGRIVGASIDSRKRRAYRLALQTREQHIRRERATSNICTSQVLLAIMASFYAIYHGPQRLKKIALRIHHLTDTLRKALQSKGFSISHERYFDTLTIKVSPSERQKILERTQKINLRQDQLDTLSVSLDETTTLHDLQNIIEVFSGENTPISLSTSYQIPKGFQRTSNFLSHKVFNSYHSETELLRYMTRLQSKDLSLTSSMIPLGSCTMKLNATTEMLPVSWPEISKLHPFVPSSQAKGYLQLFKDLETWLSDITGFKSVSLQPNSGSQGELAGLLVIRQFFKKNLPQSHRNIVLIPQSAHGTNPASAAMASFQSIPVECDKNGNIDFKDLDMKVRKHSKNLAALMITYPSTHGVFEENIKDVCTLIHHHGGQVYMDGANMNAQMGLCRPAEYGADVCHLNLHKTFCIPHGGGGPGMGPIAVASHLADYLPGHSVYGLGQEHSLTAVSAAPWGSPSILPISWTYIAMMGPDGLKKSSEIAILNANYIMSRLKDSYKILYTGSGGYVAHECIIDLQEFQPFITVEDVAKRLMDYGFHAPTVAFPVHGTLMIEPTESESKAELDRFCEAMIEIRKEIEEIVSGKMDREKNPLKLAPHTIEDLCDDWDRPYSRKSAVYPLDWVKERKFWPAVNRIDNPYGDRHLFCTCE